MLLACNRITIYQNYLPMIPLDGQLVNTNNFKPYVLQFYNIVSAEVNSSWDNITQTAKIVLPRRLKRIGYSNYTFEDYGNLDSSIFTSNIENKIYGNPQSTATSFSNRGLLKQYLDLTQTSVRSLISTDPNCNGGKIYNGITRVNPLITKGDIIVIQLGYIIKDRKNNIVFKTIDGGNTGFPNSLESVNLPNNLKKYPSSGTSFNAKNRLQPYNRGFQFKGYISKTSINNEGNIVLDCEDYMYLYNRARLHNKTFTPGSLITTPGGDEKYTLNNMLYSFAVRFDPLYGVQNTQLTGNIISDIPITAKPSTLPRPCIQPTEDDGAPIRFDNPYATYGAHIENNVDAEIGKIVVGKNATVGDVFRVLKEDYLFPIFFRPNSDVLVVGPFVYNDFNEGIVPALGTASANDGYSIYTGANSGNVGQEEFTFIMGQWNQASETTLMKGGFLKNAVNGSYKNTQNIISSNLEFRYTGDVFVGATVKSIYKTNLTTPSGDIVNTKDKRAKTEPVEYSVHVGDYGGMDYCFMYLATNQKDISSTGGTLDVNKLGEQMKAFGRMKLSHLNYEGFYGDFTISGYPYVQFSDIVNIVDFTFPERSGRYYVKKVIYKADQQSGLTQQIFLDYKLPNQTKN